MTIGIGNGWNEPELEAYEALPVVDVVSVEDLEGFDPDEFDLPDEDSIEPDDDEARLATITRSMRAARVLPVDGLRDE